MFLNSRYYFLLALKEKKKEKKGGVVESLFNKGLIVCFIWKALWIETPFSTVLPEHFTILFSWSVYFTICLTFKLLARTGHLWPDKGI